MNLNSSDPKDRENHLTDTNHKSGYFFGRRKGRPLTNAQLELFETLLAKLEIDVTKEKPLKIEQLFKQQVKGVKLEIGFGGGEHLLYAMQRNPDIGFIGVEPFMNGMSKFLSQLQNNPHLLDRIRLYNHDAVDILKWLPEDSLLGIDLFYPDPWHKQRHWKRRFVNPDNLNLFHKLIKNQGLFRFASDIDSYVSWTLEHIEAHGGFNWPATTAKDWLTPYPEWTRTRYEAKAIACGRQPSYLSFEVHK